MARLTYIFVNFINKENPVIRIVDKIKSLILIAAWLRLLDMRALLFKVIDF